MWDIHLDQLLSPSGLLVCHSSKHFFRFMLSREQQSYITTITATPALGLIKCSLFIQYFQLFRPLRWLKICVWVGATISGIFYVTVSIIAFVLSSPWPGESLLDCILSTHYILFAYFSIPTGLVGMVLDWYLLILPIPAVWSLQMSVGKKLGVLIVFMTGGL